MRKFQLIAGALFFVLVFLVPLNGQYSSQKMLSIIPASTTDSAFTGVVGPLQYSEYASSINSSNSLVFGNTTLKAAYLTVPAQWQTSFLNLTLSNLLENRTWTRNTAFDTDTSDWNFNDNSLALGDAIINQNYTFIVNPPQPCAGGWVNDTPVAGHNSSSITLNGTLDDWYGDLFPTNWYYDYYNGLTAYFEQQIIIPRGQVTSASIDCDMYVNDSVWVDPSFEIFFSIMQNNSASQQLLALTDFQSIQNYIGMWHHFRFNVDPTIFDLLTNDTIQFRYGLAFQIGGSLGGATAFPANYWQSPNQTVYFDNMQLNLQSRVKPSDVNLSIFVAGNNYNITDIDWSVGNTTFYNPFPAIRDIDPTILAFEFNTNWSDCQLDWMIDANGSTTTGVIWEPIGALLGMQYSANSNSEISWNFYIDARIPLFWTSHYRIFMNITTDWTIAGVLDPYFTSRTTQIIGGNAGDGFLEIPEDIAGIFGFWKISAISPNYMEGHSFNEMGAFTPNATYAVGSSVQLELNLSQTAGVPLNIGESPVNCSVSHPNGSIFWSESVVLDAQGLAIFPQFWIGASNTTIGQYTMNIAWTNGTAVAVNMTDFVVSHHTRLNVLLPSDFNPKTPIPALYSSPLAIRVELQDIETNYLVSGKQLTLSINNQVYSFLEVSGGIYDITVDPSHLPAPGIYNCTIHAGGSGISMDDLVVQVDFSIQQTMTFVLIGIITAMAAVIIIGVAWAKVIVPRRQRAYNDLMEFTSNYYDAHNLVGYLVLNKKDGLAIFDQWQDLAEKHVDANLISGFLTAITVFGEQMPITKNLDGIRSGKRQEKEVGEKYRTMYMDYEDFVIVLQDGQFVRVACIFAMKPTQYFEARLHRFIEEFEDTYKSFLQDFDGSLAPFQKADRFFDKHVQFAMTRPVEINQTTKAKKLQTDVDLTAEEQRMMNVLQSFLREKDYVRLRTVVSLYGSATKEAELSAVKGIVGLWFKNVLLSVNPEESLETALRFFSEEDAEILTAISNDVEDLNQLVQVTGIRREGLEAKLQSFRAWKLINLKDEVTQKGRELLQRRREKKQV